MSGLKFLKSVLGGSVCAAIMAGGASAETFNIPAGDLSAALDAYTVQTGVSLMVSSQAVKGSRTKGARGELSSNAALSQILSGTGFTERHEANGVAIVRRAPQQSSSKTVPVMSLAEAAPARAAAGIESVVVTSSKIKGDIQTVPIAITALSQEQLTSRQIAGGPDLVKEVPNLTFSKTNFTGYNIQIRGIGTQAISVTTDPAVAVAFNDMPFIRNHFFEQEFYDVGQVEVLRGPQGTLYGRNATAGVVNVISAKPTDQFEAAASADFGNYHNRRFEGMINVPIVDDRLGLRVAGEWTKRDGYSFNTLNNAPIDGRDLWSSRVTLGWKPVENVQATIVWEHFQENDDRLRSGKQLCKTAPIPSSVDGVSTGQIGGYLGAADYLSQGCEMTSLYSPEAFELPNQYALPYFFPLSSANAPINSGADVYTSTLQSRNLRDIESTINPTYRAKNDTLELNVDYAIDPDLTFTSQTGYNNDFLWSAEDYDRFDSAPGAFTSADQNRTTLHSDGYYYFCDPQLGCSDRLVLEDLSDEHSWQASQEFRLASNFTGPLNFSIGGNYLHYETEENYYVFINTLTLTAASVVDLLLPPWNPGVSDNSQCLGEFGGYRVGNPAVQKGVLNCIYIDPNPFGSFNNQGHNYFLSQNPYVLNSYAGFGEAYYNVTTDLKLTVGARWTNDQKHFIDIPSEILIPGYGYEVTNVVNQQWSQWTGRGVLNWTPKLDFTDQTLVYVSAAHGYKAGGANPPGALFPITNFAEGSIGLTTQPIHPLTFKPEFIQAFELGTKNTLLDGGLTFNADAFYYNYTGYQISEIVDRTAINNNFNAHVEGAELEASWEPIPGLKLNLAQGFESAILAKGDKSIDLMDRTAGNPNWIVVKPFVTTASNCIFPTYVVAALLSANSIDAVADACPRAYGQGVDPVTNLPYVQNPTDTHLNVLPPGYVGFDPLSVDPHAPANVNNGLGLPQNNGEGFSKNVGGNNLPNAPHFTTSVTAEYSMPVSEDWAATVHADFYWQSQQWARVFNDPIDKIRGYSTTNLALVLTSANGWQVMGYLKNVFNATAITGTFLNSDDTGLTTNVFLTDPRLFGVRVTKNF
ncbi:MAG TPA: TonB-dependent receptor plug domain-containing protein [Rhizomicrobium sp.]|nr:TonB-dependent receptor plug domain-containing protein [Rhizomicrobium sp.]